MFLTTVIYAGIRGAKAYNHLPAVQTNFESVVSNNGVLINPITFPAVSICPVDLGVNVTDEKCSRERHDNFAEDCSKPSHNIIIVSGLPYNCLTYNNDGLIKQLSTADELELEVEVHGPNQTEALGVLVILHDQGVDPSHQVTRSFWASCGKMTEVYLRLGKYQYIQSGLVENRWTAAQVSELSYKTNGMDEDMWEHVVIIDFQLPPVDGQPGWYNAQEYYVYDLNNWYGEVGGLACLLLFLHGTFCYLFMEVVSRVYRSKYGHPPDRFDVKYSRQNA